LRSRLSRIQGLETEHPGRIGVHRYPHRFELRGAYAAAVTRALPGLPVEECDRLHDPALGENFVTRAFAHAHWRTLLAAGLTADRFTAFHRR
jgi:hypothetical protein